MYSQKIFLNIPVTNFRYLFFPGLVLISLLLLSSRSFAQFIGGDATASCPQSCGVKIQITNAVIAEANDGVFVTVDWTMTQPKPEIKIKNLQVTAKVNLGVDNVENSVKVGVSQRSVTIKLSRGREFDFKDIKLLHTEVSGFADPIAAIPVTVSSRKIVGAGNDSSIEVAWNDPGTLPCTASKFTVNVTALNEKNDKLTGLITAGLNARKATAELKGAINKKGLHAPDAIVKVENDALGCVELQNFQPKLVNPPLSSGTGSIAASSAKVALDVPKLILENPNRVSGFLNWDVLIPTGFKVTNQNLKVDVEDGSGKINTFNLPVEANKRNAELGGLATPDNIRNLTVTLTVTLRDNANTQVLTREDKKTATFTNKTKDVAAIPPVQKPSTKPPTPTPPAPQITITQLQTSVEGIIHRLHGEWQFTVPTGFTLKNFTVDGALKSKLGNSFRSQIVAPELRRADFAVNVGVEGLTVAGATLKVTANLIDANGAPVQVSASRSLF